ncbi:CC/Se motif family (seleno)protein [Bacillus sp. FJAT-42315]|uniref:CC/Se motif family (seleno)protein n=1 Tax=Bacillus sp. FJAT-42315 TaxID=2014077 RepID=UPI000C23FC1A|nr:CC/Se motif family (seleno)protein [Bacillus sp. FJAT-42315]
MEFAINEKAKKWLTSHGSVLTISFLEAGKCCVSVMELAVRLGEPDDLSRFQCYTEDGLTFFIENGLKFKEDRVMISLSIFSRVQVQGVKRF